MRRLLFAVWITIAATASLPAAQYPPGLEWRTITTEHFYVHYHDGAEELARRAAAIAEAAHERVSPFLGWEPRDRTHLVLTDHIDVTNGFATTFPYNRIEIYVSAPGADPSSPLDHYDDWLHLVITHEYAHILHLDQARKLPRTLRSIFGRNPATFPNQFAPLWMIEGIATVVESEATEAGRLKGTFLDMILRTAAVEERFPSEPQASGLTPAWPGGGSRYHFGSAFLAWLARERGAEQLADYFREYSSHSIPYRINAPAREVYGQSMTSLWREWSDEAQRTYRQRADEIRAEGLTESHRLTDLGFETKYPELSPDGSRVAYAHRGAYEWPTLRVHDLRAGRDVATVRLNSISPLSWSPAGSAIAFSQLEYDGPFALLSDLYLWDVPGDGVRRLTMGARLKSPAFTPDGSSLVAVENRAGRNRLVLVDVGSGAIRPLVEPDDFRQFSEPAVSPDGESIAVAEWLDGRIDIVLYSRSGERRTNLTAALPQSTNGSPAFSSDGESVWFSSDVTGISNIYSVSIATGEVRRLTNFYGGGFFPSSTDGRTIVYADYSSRGFDIASFQPDDTFPIEPHTRPQSVVGRGEVRALTAVPPALADPDDTPYSPLRSLRPRWWFPIAAATSAGAESEAMLGAMTTGADALGFHSYQAQIVSVAREDGSSIDYSLAYSYDRLFPTLTIATSGYSDPSSLVLTREDTQTRYRERIQRTIAQATFPHRRFRWQGSLTVGGIHESIEADAPFDIGTESLESVGLFEGELTGGRIAAGFNSSRTFGYSISPENGVIALVDAQFLGGDRTVRQARADLRGYLSIPLSRSPFGRHVAALRLTGGTVGGDFLLERELKVGGTGGESLLTTSQTHFPVRGFATGTLRGRNAALLSAEYRVPLYEIDRGPSGWPLFFHRISGNLFLDAATAWYPHRIDLPAVKRPVSEPFDETTTLASAGAELALDLYLGFYVPIRYRVGAAYVLDAPPCPSPGCDRDGGFQFYVGLGRSF
jgi:Tol biopolymer transport system component